MADSHEHGSRNPRAPRTGEAQCPASAAWLIMPAFLYSFVWTISFGLYGLGWIRYNSLSPEAWIYISVAWVSFSVGAAAATYTFPTVIRAFDASKLRAPILMLSAAGTLYCFTLARDIMQKVDENILAAVLFRGNELYALRFFGELSGIPYVGYCTYAACALAGVYTRYIGAIGRYAVIPLALILIDGLLSAQRAGIVIGALLFGFALWLTPSRIRFSLRGWQVSGLAVVILAGFFWVSATRGIEPTFDGQSAELNLLADFAAPLPSIYMYLTAPIPGFSAYLSDRNEPEFFGRNTLAPLYRMLARLGFDTHVPHYAEFYPTPIPINTCTYLRDVHADFGAFGVVLFPFGVAYLATALWRRRLSMNSVVTLAHMLVWIAFSFSSSIAITGYWYFSLFASVLAIYFAEKAALRPDIAYRRSRRIGGTDG